MTTAQKLGTGLLLAGLLLSASARAQMQSSRDLAELGMDLYQRANSPEALARMRKDLVNAPEAYLERVELPGTLVLLDKRRVRVPAMKYNVALRLLEVRDSTGSHVWPPGSLDGFYLGKGSDMRHFRSKLVRNGSTKLDFVEVLTQSDNSPLVLAVQHIYRHLDAQLDPILRTETKAESTEIGQTVLAGTDLVPKEPLRAISLNRKSVSELFGSRAPEITAWASNQGLSYTDLGQVLRMVEYYNQLSFKKP
ncbi:hypothetical protein KB206_05160 [Microvirga sp. STS02]|uniref:hypothetical protein n=1 Tax=Hymenobacter negativus TaxID=2795026 RepID=UPI0018DBF23A|nr:MULTISPECIES: hypothetical protein [Bacteria]MBH8568260.1 hypothetical protein [Hymenobacter negativus]MBR7207995.1 hypothetical protein [Microvirga sp. STS02]